MPFKGTRSRPGTASEEKRQTTYESPSTIRQSSPVRGHRKSSSWKKLSLSFALGHDDPFQNFLLHDASESNSNQPLEGSGHSTPGRGDRHVGVVNNSSNSLGGPGPAVENEDRSRNRSTSRIRENGQATQQPQNTKPLKAALPANVVTAVRHRKRTEGESDQIPPPTIVTTAPSHQVEPQAQRKGKDKLLPKAFGFRKNQVDSASTTSGAYEGKKSSDLMRMDMPHSSGNRSRENLGSMGSISNQISPPAYGEEADSALAVPVSRLSDSSRSEGSSASHKLYAQTTTTHVVSTTTSFFKIKRKNKKKKDKGPLFPLPEHLPPPSSGRTSISRNAGDASTIGRKSMSPSRKSVQAVRFETSNGARESPISSPMHSSAALPGAHLGSPGPAITRKQSTLSTHSGASTPSISLLPPRLGARGRSSTMGSMGCSSERVDSVGPVPSGRTSTSTTGRKSFGDLFMSHRMRQNSAPPRHAAGTFSNPDSKANSFQIAREPEPELVYPRREDSDTPATYLEKLEAAIPRGAMATVLCKSGDDFSKTCLRKYMRGFSYFGESIDMSIRKMLMEVILPKETQQIDRLLSGFADRYHECNPGIFTNADEANFVAFSILLLQSDSHNKNNKRKMTKQDYIKNTQNGKISVADDVLECFYDNICYTPFIHFEDEVAVNSHRLGTPRGRKGLIKTKSNENLRGPLDPYALILDNKLDILRPSSLKDVIETEDTYSSTGSMLLPNSNEYHKFFVNSSVLQIVSARSRPDAFMNQATITNPAEAQAGLVSIKVAKVGLLWRKSTKKKKAKSPWQEWGAILTDSKLYFFKDVGWVKRLMYQYESHKKLPSKSGPLVFKPPVTSFDPDALMGVEDAVALTDSSYRKHKHAFTFIKHGGFEEVFLANTEADMNDWLGKLNYAATFRTAGVRMRGLLGTTYEGRHLLRQNSEISANANETQSNEQALSESKDSSQMSWEIMFYRRQLVSEKISAFDDHVATAQKELEYLLRNSRHLLVQLPIQQKTREGMVLAAGRMNAKLKWTRKEIWRAKTHRDVLVKDLEAESTLDLHNIAGPMSGRSPLISPSEKSSTTKASKDPLVRQDTDKSVISMPSPFITPQSTRGPPQSILEKIQTDNAVPPELTATRRPSASSHLSPASRANLIHAESHAPGSIEGKAEVHSLVTQPSTISSHKAHKEEEWSAKFEESYEDRFRPESLILSSPESRDKRRGSEPERDTTPAISHTRDSSLKDRASGVRRSLHRTLREPHHVHIPGHQRSKKGKESSSSIAVTEDSSKSIGGESEELRRDPTGRFVLHGKKASVITMGPEWQRLTPEERMKLRQPSVVEGSTYENGATDRVASPSSSKGDYLRPFATPVGSSSMLSDLNDRGDVFHSASSSRRASFGSSDREEEN